jgi:ribosomal protein S1
MPNDHVETTGEVVETPSTDDTVETTNTEATASVSASAPDAPAPNSPNTITKLKPKMRIEGTIQSVKLYGALVNIGVERPALLHISQIRQKRVRNVSDHIKEGEKIVAWVYGVDTEHNRVELTLIEPPALSWDEMTVNSMVTGKIVRIENFGAFIDIGAERPGLIHVSELANEFVSSPEEVVKVGDEVEARIINVDKRKKQVDLSLRASTQPTVVEEAPEDDEMLTAMALALKQAMEGNEDKRRKKGKKHKYDRSREMQEDIIERTLRHNPR